jgi:hypothetical protein
MLCRKTVQRSGSNEKQEGTTVGIGDCAPIPLGFPVWRNAATSMVQPLEPV